MSGASRSVALGPGVEVDFRLRSLNELLQSPRVLKSLAAGGSVLALLLIGILSAPAFVRGKVERAARERGFEAQIGSVGFGWGSVAVRDLRVTAPGDSDFEARIDGVRVSVLSGAVSATGGSVRGKGEPARILDKVRGKGRASSGEGGSGREISVSGLFVRWERDGVTVSAPAGGRSGNAARPPSSVSPLALATPASCSVTPGNGRKSGRWTVTVSAWFAAAVQWSSAAAARRTLANARAQYRKVWLIRVWNFR